MKFQLDLFAIERPAAVHTDMVFFHAGRPLRVHKSFGTDAAAPVIVEELAAFGTTLKGQFGLWSADAVARCMRGK